MSVPKAIAALLLVLVLASPGTASAVDWAEWKRLVRERPVAVLVAIPPLILTSPFMGVAWLVSDRGGDDDE